MSQYVIGMAVGFLLVVLFFAIIAKIVRKNGGSEKEYDERQLLERGKAYQCGFFTYVFEVAIAVLVKAGDYPLPKFMDPLCWYGLAFFIPLAVFSFVAISRDALFAFNMTGRRAYVLYIIAWMANFVPAMGNLISGNMIKDGVLQAGGGFMNLLLAILFGVVLIATFIKERRPNVEEED